MKRQRGFTLMEMLVVVAIIAILAAVAIPTFSSSLDSARAATCAANRQSLKSALSAVSISEGDAAVTAYFEAHREEYVCPSGGTITVSDPASGVIKVSCSIHTGSLGNSATIDTLIKNLQKLKVDADSGAKDLPSSDSFAGAANTLVTALAAEGLDLESMGAKTWHYSKSSQFFFWTPVDISTLSTGTELPVLRYNLKTGTYTVWINKVIKSNQGDYLVLDGTSANNDYAPSTGDKDQSYDRALEHFNEAMKKYPDLLGGG